MYPGFKSAFSDVIGYFYVSSSANKLLTDLLVNKDIEKVLKHNDPTPRAKEYLKRCMVLVKEK